MAVCKTPLEISKIYHELSVLKNMINVRDKIVEKHKNDLVNSGKLKAENFEAYMNKFFKGSLDNKTNALALIKTHESNILNYDKECSQKCPENSTWDEKTNACICNDTMTYLDPLTGSCKKCENILDKPDFIFEKTFNSCICKDPLKVIYNYKINKTNDEMETGEYNHETDIDDYYYNRQCVPRKDTGAEVDEYYNKFSETISDFKTVIGEQTEEINYCIKGMDYETVDGKKQCICNEPQVMKGKLDDISDPPRCECEIMLTCKPGQTLSKLTCKCEWNTTCNDNQVRNESNGNCDCKIKCPPEKPIQNPKTCDCSCPILDKLSKTGLTTEDLNKVSSIPNPDSLFTMLKQTESDLQYLHSQLIDSNPNINNPPNVFNTNLTHTSEIDISLTNYKTLTNSFNTNLEKYELYETVNSSGVLPKNHIFLPETCTTKCSITDTMCKAQNKILQNCECICDPSKIASNCSSMADNNRTFDSSCNCKCSDYIPPWSAMAALDPLTCKWNCRVGEPCNPQNWEDGKVIRPAGAGCECWPGKITSYRFIIDRNVIDRLWVQTPVSGSEPTHTGPWFAEAYIYNISFAEGLGSEESFIINTFKSKPGRSDGGRVAVMENGNLKPLNNASWPGKDIVRHGIVRFAWKDV
jgi:hypothetical protein